MSELSGDDLVPVSGKLGQLIFEDPGAGIAARLEFFIELAFQAIDDEESGEELKPLYRANNIIVPGARCWKQLAGTCHEFPWAPKAGSIDAAVLLFGVHNPADLVRIEFGEISGERIAVSFRSEVDFEVEADRDDLEQVDLDINLPLDIEPLRVATSLEKRCQGDPEAITSAVREWIDTDAYGEVQKVPGGFALPIA